MAAAITDLAVSFDADGVATLTWTTPAYTSAGGDAVYAVRCSVHGMDAGTFAVAYEVADAPAPATEGDPVSVTVAGLTPGYAYSFAATLDDDDGVSDLSNVATARLTDPIYRWLTTPEAKLVALWTAQHRFLTLREGGVSTPGVITPSAGKRIIINSISAQVSAGNNTVEASSPGVERAIIAVRFAAGAMSRYWQGWPWFVALRDQPVTVALASATTPTWLYASVGYCEV